MKVSKPTLFFILILTAGHLFSQSNQDFIIIDEIADDITELLVEFGNQPNVYVTDANTPDALEQISGQLVNMSIADLHIYVPTKPGAIVFSSIAITSENVDELPFDLTDWTKVISGKVVIHSDVVFTGEEGILLKQQLENKSGVVFISQH